METFEQGPAGDKQEMQDNWGVSTGLVSQIMWEGLATMLLPGTVTLKPLKHKFVIFLSSTAICYFAQDKFEVIRVAPVDNKVYGGSMQVMWLEH